MRGSRAGTVARMLMALGAGSLHVGVLSAQCSSLTPITGTFTSGDHSQVATDTIRTGDPYTLSSGATATFVAGNCIRLGPGFTAASGNPNRFHAWVDVGPTPVMFSPASGSGQSQQFTFKVSNPSGQNNLAHVFALFHNTSDSTVNACYIHYDPSADLVYLANNESNNWLGGFTPQSSQSAGDSQCTVSGSGIPASRVETQLTVKVGVTFQTSFQGTKYEYLYAADSSGQNTAWRLMGTWDVPGQQYYLTTGVNTAEAGSITPGGSITPSCPLGCAYNSGYVATVSASANPGYEFMGFTGALNGMASPQYLPMDGAKSVVAHFAPSGAKFFSFPYTDAGGATRTWTFTTQALNHVFTWDSSHWTYQPSVVLPAPQTNGKYVLLFSAGTTYGQEGIYMATANSPTGPFTPSPPAEALHIGGNLCDMASSVPYWDDAAQIWHVYVQAVKWTSGVCREDNAGIYEAVGPSLTSLSWVMDPANPGQAREIIGPYAPVPPGRRNPGIGERIQWFNSTNYQGLGSASFVVTFNDWTYTGQDCQPYNPNGAYVCAEYCPLCNFTNGTPVFAYASPDGTSPLYFWYYRQPAAGQDDSYFTIYYPDVILSGSLDAATAGHPGFGFESQPCGLGPEVPDQPCKSYGVGFFPDPVPYANPLDLPYNGGFYFPGMLKSTNDEIMFRPRVARNVYGYVHPVADSWPRRWQTYVYYSDCNWYPYNKGCGFGVSLLTITQQ